ncbi:hypothetical protein BDR26DRAFT_11216 [Obelidium mucronatum]|nr:hypothetical protein BDR26DRAFT_11216 [Obelidium mucronatum]
MYLSVIKSDALFIYSSDEKLECQNVFLLWQYDVILSQGYANDHEIYQRHTPLQLSCRSPATAAVAAPQQPQNLFIYSLTNSEKEDWYLLLRRGTMSRSTDPSSGVPLPTQPDIQQNYIQSMQKLTAAIERDPASAWINALLGRIFVGFRSNPRIKRYLIQKFSRHSRTTKNTTTTTAATKESSDNFLSDIIVQDINIGDSIPVLSNPRLVNFGISEGDLIVDLDLNYTGGIQISAATLATISVSKLNLAPFTIPLTVTIKISHIRATIRLKIKPFHETSRVWVGIHPDFDIGIQVDPVISNRLLKLDLVNQVIENRVKNALQEFLVLPNMDDFGFWPFQQGGRGAGGFFWDDYGDGEEGEEDDEYDVDDASVSGVAYFSESERRASVGVSAQKLCMRRRSSSKISTSRRNSDVLNPTYNQGIRRQSSSIATSTENIPKEQQQQQKLETSLMKDTANNGAPPQQRPFSSISSISPSVAVQTNEFWIKPQSSSEFSSDDDEMLRQSILKHSKTKLCVVGGTSDKELPQQPPDSTPPENEINQEHSENYASLLEETKEIPAATTTTKVVATGVFEYLGGLAEYAGVKTREYRIKQIGKIVGKAAFLAADVGLGYLGYTRERKPGIVADAGKVSEERPSGTKRGPLKVTNKSPESSKSHDDRKRDTSRDSDDRKSSVDRSFQDSPRQKVSEKYADSQDSLSSRCSSVTHRTSLLEAFGIEIHTSSPNRSRSGSNSVTSSSRASSVTRPFQRQSLSQVTSNTFLTSKAQTNKANTNSLRSLPSAFQQPEQLQTTSLDAGLNINHNNKNSNFKNPEPLSNLQKSPQSDPMVHFPSIKPSTTAHHRIPPKRLAEQFPSPSNSPACVLEDSFLSRKETSLPQSSLLHEAVLADLLTPSSMSSLAEGAIGGTLQMDVNVERDDQSVSVDVPAPQQVLAGEGEGLGVESMQTSVDSLNVEEHRPSRMVEFIVGECETDDAESEDESTMSIGYECRAVE